MRAAVTLAVVAFVVAGSGMWLHQKSTSADLPTCGADWDTVASQASIASPDGLVPGLWHEARGVITAPITGVAHHYADKRGGGLCAAGSMTVAFLPSAASDSGLTVGDMFLTGLPEDDAHTIAVHESRHVSQWAALTLLGGPLAMPVLYGADEAFFPGPRNHFERAAGLADGGYRQPSDFAPRPEWIKVGVIAFVVAMLTWRRLRWATRVLTRGWAAGKRRDPGRCALHSHGWFGLSARPV
ncbi:MAG TPA: hypothetical protein VFG63_07760 [Nocardioidaceae bacterium]|nr:hypothetical protein [Nocardioidaceae bacterium]